MAKVNRGVTRQKQFKQAGPGRKRFELLHHRKAVAFAKRGTTIQTKLGETGLDFRPVGSLIEGQVLKKGIIGMGVRAVAPDWMMEKLQKMDARYLQGLYESNRLLFEVYFSYEGIDYHDGVYEVDDQKLDDIELLINEYERVYGPIR
jgi:hypothetical protein